jgi:RecB family endonuclease NucS
MWIVGPGIIREVPAVAFSRAPDRCSLRVTYGGPLATVLPMAVHLLVLKSDGSMVHADTGGYRPQNCD